MIKVKSIWDLNNIYQVQCVYTGFETSEPIPEEKFPIIKKAIEQAINNPLLDKTVESELLLQKWIEEAGKKDLPPLTNTQRKFVEFLFKPESIKVLMQIGNLKPVFLSVYKWLKK